MEKSINQFYSLELLERVIGSCELLLNTSIESCCSADFVLSLQSALCELQEVRSIIRRKMEMDA